MTTSLDTPAVATADDSLVSVRSRHAPAGASDTRPLRVAHVLGGREGGGITTAVASLLGGLASHGVSPSVVILRGQPTDSDSRLAQFAPHYLPKSRGKLGTVRALARYCRDEQIDIVQTHSISSNFYGRLAARRAGAPPVVTTVHAKTADELRGTFGNTWLEALVAGVDLQMHRASTRLITVSPWLKDELVSRGVPQEKITAISHGVRVETPTGDEFRQQQLRDELQIPADHLIVGIVGRLTPVKNHRLFLEMARQVRAKRSDVSFVIVGDGPLREELHSAVESMGLADVVALTGWVDTPRDYFRLFDVLVSTSDSEGFGYVVLEAMASATAVVTTSVSEMPAIVDAPQTGLLTPPGDAAALATAVRRLLDDRGLRHSMGLAARQRVADLFSLEHEIAQYAEVYHQIGEGRAG